MLFTKKRTWSTQRERRSREKGRPPDQPKIFLLCGEQRNAIMSSSVRLSDKERKVWLEHPNIVPLVRLPSLEDDILVCCTVCRYSGLRGRRQSRNPNKNHGIGASMMIIKDFIPILFATMATHNSNNNEIIEGGGRNNNNVLRQQPSIEGVTSIAKTKWLELQTLTYKDQEGKERKWDSVTRTTRKASADADAVVIVPILKRFPSPSTSSDNDENDVMDTILVEQFRPPVGQSTIEFPAGLIDEDETPEQAALRELREETGYIGEACRVLPQVSRPCCMSPGVTDESVHIVVVEVDLNNPYNIDPKPELDDGEYVTIKRLSLKDGIQQLLDQGTSMPIEGLYLFALGLELGRKA